MDRPTHGTVVSMSHAAGEPAARANRSLGSVLVRVRRLLAEWRTRYGTRTFADRPLRECGTGCWPSEGKRN